MRRYIEFCMVLACAAMTIGCDSDSRRAEAVRSRPEGAIVLAVVADAVPYAYIDASGEFHGIDVDIARAAAAKMGRRLEIRVAGLDELIPLVKSGEVDMAASGLSITAGRLRSVDFSIPYVEDGGAFLYRTGERMPTMILAETIRVAAMDSMTHDFYLTRHGIDPLRYHSFAEAVGDVEHGKVDAMYHDRSRLVVIAKRSNGRLAVTPLVTREHFGIAVHRGMPELKAALDAVIRERAAK